VELEDVFRGPSSVFTNVVNAMPDAGGGNSA